MSFDNIGINSTLEKKLIDFFNAVERKYDYLIKIGPEEKILERYRRFEIKWMNSYSNFLDAEMQYINSAKKFDEKSLEDIEKDKEKLDESEKKFIMYSKKCERIIEETLENKFGYVPWDEVGVKELRKRVNKKLKKTKDKLFKSKKFDADYIDSYRHLEEEWNKSINSLIRTNNRYIELIARRSGSPFKDEEIFFLAKRAKKNLEISKKAYMDYIRYVSKFIGKKKK